MSKRKLAGFTGEFQAGSANTSPITYANVPAGSNPERVKLGAMVSAMGPQRANGGGDNTFNFNRMTAPTPIPRNSPSDTQSMGADNSPIDNPADEALYDTRSPVRIGGKSSHSPWLHATIEALRLAGEHEGNNKKVIGNLVSQ